MKRVFCVLAAFISLCSLKAEDPLVGVVTKVFGMAEISVIFQEPVNTTSLLDVDNYHLSRGQIVELRQAATNRGVILMVSNLPLRSTTQLTIDGVLNEASEPIHYSTTVETLDRVWTPIGGNELGFIPDVLAVSTNGFDLFSGGVQQFEDYDEATFAGHEVNGDFDEVTRVEWVDPAGRGAKAGIMVREKLNAVMPRAVDPEDPATMFSRYIELTVRAPQSADGEATGGSHKIYMRPTTGSPNLQSLTVTNDAAPAFPDAWLRVQRVGPEFRMYRGINGRDWEQIGSAQFPETAPSGVYVGVAFTPQNEDFFANPELKNLYVAKFRNYSSTNFNTFITLQRTQTAGQAELSWTGVGWTLETATLISGPWQDAPAQGNPQVITINVAEPARFYRLRR